MTLPVTLLLIYLIACGVVLNAGLLFWLWTRLLGWLIDLRVRA